jgi:AcrR family transcriptional regulator
LTEFALPDVRVAHAAMETATRDSLLEAAARVLAEEGPSALTVRRVADSVNGTTKMIYKHFGGKDGLLNAVYLHSFASLTQALRVEPEPSNPVSRLSRMAIAYRQFALANQAHYNVMFGDLGRAWEAPSESRREAWKSFGTLRDAIHDALPSGRAKEVVEIAHLFWAAMHGVVSLEMRKLIGTAQDGERLFTRAIDAVAKTYGIPL